MRKLVFIFALVAGWLCSMAAVPSYEDMSRMGIKELVDLGTAFLVKQNKPEQALMAFNLAAGKYRGGLTAEQKKECMRACYGQWLIYFNHFCNYQKAFESIMRARDIGDDIHQEQPQVYLMAGNIFQTISEQNNDNRLMRRAYTYYNKACEIALAQKDEASVDISFSNLLTTAHALGAIRDISALWRQYRSLSGAQHNARRTYNYGAYQVYALWAKHDYARALRVADRLISGTPDDPEHIRLLLNAYLNKANLLSESGQNAEANRLLDVPERLAGQSGLKDALLEIYELRAKLLTKMHQTQLANASQDRFLKLKDSLYISRQLSNIDEMQFGYDLKKKDERLQQEALKRRMFMQLAVVLVLVALLLTVMLCIIKKKNNRLKESNRQLYLKIRAQLKSEDTEQIVYHKYEEEISSLQQRFAGGAEMPKPKYKGSELSEDDKGKILAGIKKVMANKEEICSPEFSVIRLSTLAGYRPKDISEVIHDFYNCNFNVFLNEYRIKEACRRLAEDSVFKRLTVQGMANSVGFKSRSAFIAAFKRFAGLTPSEYIKISAQANVEREAS